MGTASTPYLLDTYSPIASAQKYVRFANNEHNWYSYFWTWWESDIEYNGWGDSLQAFRHNWDLNNWRLAFANSSGNHLFTIWNSGQVWVGIWRYSPKPSDKLDVNWNIRTNWDVKASRICDENWNNCKDISAWWSSGGGSGTDQPLLKNKWAHASRSYMMSWLYAHWNWSSFTTTSGHSWNWDLNMNLWGAYAYGNTLVIPFDDPYAYDPFCSVELEDLVTIREVDPNENNIIIRLYLHNWANYNWSSVSSRVIVTCHWVD